MSLCRALEEEFTDYASTGHRKSFRQETVRIAGEVLLFGHLLFVLTRGPENYIKTGQRKPRRDMGPIEHPWNWQNLQTCHVRCYLQWQTTSSRQHLIKWATEARVNPSGCP